jgi:HK97 family phage major capsid protein
MTVTLKSNLFVPQILADVLTQGFAGQKALLGTGAVTVNTSLPDSARGGDTVTIPRFNAFAAAQTVADGSPLVPAALTMDSETATVVQVGNAIQITRFAELAAKFADPYSEAGRQILETIQREWDAQLLAAAVNATGLPAGQKISVWNATTPKTLDLPTMILGKMAYGDEQDGIAALCIHSKVLGDLYGLNDTLGRPLLIESPREGGLPTVLGIPTIVSDRMPKDVTDAVHPKYTSMFIKKGALVLWANGAPQVNEFRDPLTNSDIMAWFSYFAPYRVPNMPGCSKNGVVTLVSN